MPRSKQKFKQQKGDEITVVNLNKLDKRDSRRTSSLSPKSDAKPEDWITISRYGEKDDFDY